MKYFAYTRLLTNFMHQQSSLNQNIFCFQDNVFYNFPFRTAIREQQKQFTFHVLLWHCYLCFIMPTELIFFYILHHRAAQLWKLSPTEQQSVSRMPLTRRESSSCQILELCMTVIDMSTQFHIHAAVHLNEASCRDESITTSYAPLTVVQWLFIWHVTLLSMWFQWRKINYFPEHNSILLEIVKLHPHHLQPCQTHMDQ